MPEIEEDAFFAELNAEIAKATAKSRLHSDAAKLKREALNMRLSARIRQRAADELRSLQTIIEAETWQIVRCGALFAEQSCDGCGSVHYNFLQYMQEERKIRNPSSVRWVRVVIPAEGLARETIIQPLTTHICSDCCTDHNFDVQRPNIRLLPREGSLTVSSTYVQGDINGTNEED